GARRRSVLRSSQLALPCNIRGTCVLGSAHRPPLDVMAPPSGGPTLARGRRQAAGVGEKTAVEVTASLTALLAVHRPSLGLPVSPQPSIYRAPIWHRFRRRRTRFRVYTRTELRGSRANTARRNFGAGASRTTRPAARGCR